MQTSIIIYRLEEWIFHFIDRRSRALFPSCLEYQSVGIPIYIYAMVQLQHLLCLLIWGPTYYQRFVSRYCTSSIYSKFWGKNKKIFKDRHDIWMPRIEHISCHEEDHLIVFGLNHMFGQDGILKRLKN